MRLNLFIVQAACLGLFLWLESIAPFFMERTPQQRFTHAARNLAIGAINGLFMSAVFSGLVTTASRWGELHPIGLLHYLRFGNTATLITGFILFDLWMYFWHRANHRLPVLWRFHRVHHTDTLLDATSAVRFHLGELILSTILRLAVIPLLGISFWNLLLYELVLGPVILFHHSNIALPQKIDRWMRWLIVSPNMHRVHHSDIPSETNSNYASIFSFWDRLMGTYRRRNTRTIRLGLKDFPGPRWQTVPGMLELPLKGA